MLWFRMLRKKPSIAGEQINVICGFSLTAALMVDNTSWAGIAANE